MGKLHLITNKNRLILYRKVIVVCRKNNTKSINSLHRFVTWGNFNVPIKLLVHTVSIQSYVVEQDPAYVCRSSYCIKLPCTHHNPTLCIKYIYIYIHIHIYIVVILSHCRKLWNSALRWATVALNHLIIHGFSFKWPESFGIQNLILWTKKGWSGFIIKIC